MIHIEYTAEQAHADRLKAIALHMTGAIRTPVVIEHAGFITPKGRRAVRATAQHKGATITLYVGGRIHRILSNNPANRALAQEWVTEKC